MSPFTNPSSIGLAVITYYPHWYRGKLRSIKHSDKVRGDLAIEFAQKATAKGLTIVYVDGKSSKSFKKALGEIAGLHVIRRRTFGRSPSKRQAITYLTKLPEIKVIILTESEKISLITDCLDNIVMPILEDKAEIVVPKREDRLFKSSYPLYMYESETEANRIYNEALRTNGILKQNTNDLDFFFGPRVFKNEKKVVELFKRKYTLKKESFLAKLYDPDEYSNTQFFPVINALRNNMRVLDVEVPFSYPNIQKENEDIGARAEFILKRKMQRTSLLIDLMHFLSFLAKKRTSGLREAKSF